MNEVEWCILSDTNKVQADQPASMCKHTTEAEILRHTRKSYVKRSPGGIGH